MQIGNINLKQDVMIVAEIGNNHEGNFQLAKEMVKLAADTGVHAVKFQTFKTENFIYQLNTKRFKQLKSYELSYTEFEKLSEMAQSCGLIFLSTPFDIESAIFLNDIVPAFKISSGDNSFYPLLEVVSKTGKPIIISGGCADIPQLKKTQAFINKIWDENKINQEMIFLHCVSSYPVPSGQENLKAIHTIRDQLSCIVGYSDHTIGIDAACIAVTLGAKIIEKHFTIDKNYSDFRDHQISADPNDMKKLVDKVNLTLKMLGSGEKILQISELETLSAVKRSVVATKDLSEGSIISKDDIKWVRHSGGITSGKEDLIYGKKLLKSVNNGEIFSFNYLK